MGSWGEKTDAFTKLTNVQRYDVPHTFPARMSECLECPSLEESNWATADSYRENNEDVIPKSWDRGE